MYFTKFDLSIFYSVFHTYFIETRVFGVTSKGTQCYNFVVRGNILFNKTATRYFLILFLQYQYLGREKSKILINLILTRELSSCSNGNVSILLRRAKTSSWTCSRMNTARSRSGRWTWSGWWWTAISYCPRLARPWLGSSSPRGYLAVR